MAARKPNPDYRLREPTLVGAKLSQCPRDTAQPPFPAGMLTRLLQMSYLAERKVYTFFIYRNIRTLFGYPAIDKGIGYWI